MKNNNEHLEGFLNILKENHNNSVEKVNMSLYDDICQTAEILERTESENEKKAIKDSLRERFKNVNLNQVTDLFIYNQMFFTSNEDPLPTPSILCINIGKLFTKQKLTFESLPTIGQVKGLVSGPFMRKVLFVQFSI